MRMPRATQRFMWAETLLTQRYSILLSCSCPSVYHFLLGLEPINRNPSASGQAYKAIVLQTIEAERAIVQVIPRLQTFGTSGSSPPALKFERVRLHLVHGPPWLFRNGSPFVRR